MNFSFIDLFCGIGGFHQGLAANGGHCVIACDVNRKAADVYQHNYHSDSFVYDIFDLGNNSIPPANVVTAGFPCQPFSISGKHKGFSDDRSTVFPELIRVIKISKPDVFILENVKYIQHIKSGTVFNEINRQLGELGYFVDWKVLNARDFGVAQNRERVFWIGTKHKPFDFSALQVNMPPTFIRDILDIEGEFEFLREPFTLIDTPKLQASGLKFVGHRNKRIRKAGVRPNTEHLSRVHKQPNRIYSIDGVHPTIPSQESSGRFWILLDDGRVRKLTLNECYKLMGFDKNFVNDQPPGTQYVQIGNSVCVPVVKSIVAQIKQQGHLLNGSSLLKRAV